MMSQYTVAAIVGWVIDRRGPAICSLFAALLFAFGFGGFSWEVYNTPEDISSPLHGAFYRLSFFFFFVGLGTVFGWVPLVDSPLISDLLLIQIFFLVICGFEDILKSHRSSVWNEHGPLRPVSTILLYHCIQILY